MTSSACVAAAASAPRLGVGADRPARRRRTPASTTTDRRSAASTPASTSARSRGPSGPRASRHERQTGPRRPPRAGRARRPARRPGGAASRPDPGPRARAGRARRAASPARSTSRRRPVGARERARRRARRRRRSVPDATLGGPAAQRARHPPRRTTAWGKVPDASRSREARSRAGPGTGRTGGRRSGARCRPTRGNRDRARPAVGRGCSRCPSPCATVDRAPVCSPAWRPRSSTSTRRSSPRRRWSRSAGRSTAAGMISRWLMAARPLRPARLPAPRRRRGAACGSPRVGARAHQGLGPGPRQRHRPRDAHRGHRADRLRRGARAHPGAPGRRAAGVHHLGVTRGDRGAAGPYLGVDEAIASRAKLDDEGRYTGEVEFYSYGPYKAEAIVERGAPHDIDLAASYAYSDSATDLPMLEIVGHPVAVNPDRELARIAASASGRCASSATGFRSASGSTCRRRAAPAAGRGQRGAAGHRRGGWAGGCGADGRASRSAVPGRADQLRQAADGLGSQGALGWFGGQASCSFFTAKAARARTTMRTRSFFMGGSIGRAPGALSRASRSL